MADGERAPVRNWAGNITFAATRVVAPSSVAELARRPAQRLPRFLPPVG